MIKREIQDKRAKGLCFKCDGRWGFNHVCRAKELSILLVKEDGDKVEEEEFTTLD